MKVTETEIPKFDVAVIGGGIAGFCAAIAARRMGAKTLLVERLGFLGGAATAGSVGQFVGWETRRGRRVVRGIGDDLVDCLKTAGGTLGHGRFTMSTGHRMDRVEYAPEILKVVLDGMASDCGLHVLFHGQVTAVERDAAAVRQVVIDTPTAALRIAARCHVDASGDMNLLTRAGAAFLKLETDESLQAATMMFAMAPVDFDRLDKVGLDSKQAIIARGLQSGDLPRAALHYNRVPDTDAAWFNITRVTVDPTDPFSLSAGEIEGRRQAFRVARFLRENLPGCGKARLSALAPQLGIRDSRRIVGDYVITAEDIRSGAAFDDTIACGAYPIDIHPANGSGLTIEEFGEDHFYRIPYRALLPRGLKNVIAAGRGISATHDAFAALRVMPTAMAMGHAAGVAAALAAISDGDVRKVAVNALQGILSRQNAFLGI